MERAEYHIEGLKKFEKKGLTKEQKEELAIAERVPGMAPIRQRHQVPSIGTLSRPHEMHHVPDSAV